MNLLDLPISQNELFTNPPSVSVPFQQGGASCGAIFATAINLVEQYLKDRSRRSAPVLLVTEDRQILAAVIIAAMQTEAQIVLPYADTPDVLDRIVKELNVDCILTDHNLDVQSSVPQVIIEVISDNAPLPQLKADIHAPLIHLFTGGTTGRPQYWQKSSFNLLAEAQYLAKRFSLGPSDRICALVPPNHIYGLLYTILMPLVSGASIVEAAGFLPREVMRTLASTRCTILIGVPIHYKALVNQKPKDIQLRLAFSSASPLDEQHAKAFHQVFSIPIVEVYGSTETGGIATRCRADGENDWICYELVQWKVEGDEFLIASPFLSMNLPKDGEGFSRVADRIRKIDDRRFQLEGRTDQIVKVSGKRVDLAEIEERIIGIEGIADTHLLVAKTESVRDQIIVALVVSNLPFQTITEKIRAKLSPAAMPRKIVVVKEIPRRPNGKLDQDRILAIVKKNRFK